MERFRWTAFIVGCVAILVSVGTTLTRQGEAAYNYDTLIILAVLGLAVASLIATTLFCKARERWKSLLFVAILLLGFSALTFFGIGIIIAPVAFVLLGVSIWKLAHRRVESTTC